MRSSGFSYTVELTFPGNIQDSFMKPLGAAEGLGAIRVGKSKTPKGSRAPERPDEEEVRETHTPGEWLRGSEGGRRELTENPLSRSLVSLLNFFKRVLEKESLLQGKVKPCHSRSPSRGASGKAWQSCEDQRKCPGESPVELQQETHRSQQQHQSGGEQLKDQEEVFEPGEQVCLSCTGKGTCLFTESKNTSWMLSRCGTSC